MYGHTVQVKCGKAEARPCAQHGLGRFTLALYKARVDYRDALVVAISQSGGSADTNLVLERARAQGALTVGITNEPKSSPARLGEHTFLVRAGRVKSVAATKTYTGQVLMLYPLAYALGGRLKLDQLRRLPERAAEALRLEPEIAALSERYEFALKMMDSCKVFYGSRVDLPVEPFRMIARRNGITESRPVAGARPNFRAAVIRPGSRSDPRGISGRH